MLEDRRALSRFLVEEFLIAIFWHAIRFTFVKYVNELLVGLLEIIEVFLSRHDATYIYRLTVVGLVAWACLELGLIFM